MVLANLVAAALLIAASYCIGWLVGYDDCADDNKDIREENDLLLKTIDKYREMNYELVDEIENLTEEMMKDESVEDND